MRDYVLTLLVAAAVTYLLTPLIRRLAGQIGAMKQPRDRDVHVVPVPTIGGLAMYGGLAAGLLIADQIPQLRTGLANTGMISGLLLAGGLLVVIGFIDDRWGMDALPKAAGQVAAGGILVATGTSLSWIPLPGGNTYVPTTDQATLLTILVVVATINAVNFIDGLDGLAAGIVCIAAVSFFLYYYTLTRVIDISSLAAPALASAILIGMCLGFLPHNFSPATIFMGDTGSMLLGLLLAYAPISSITSLPPANLTSQINRYPVLLPLLLPAALLVIPYGDMLLAVVRRTRAGKSPFAPDRKHLHHRLLDIGHSQRTSVLIMYLWAAAFSGTVVGLSIQKTVQRGNSNHHGAPIFVFVIITAIAFAVLLLLSMPRLRWWQRPRLAGLADAGPARANAAGAGVAGAVNQNGPGTGPALESPVLETPALGSTVTGGPGLAGMTGGPALSVTGPAGEVPGGGSRLGRGPAEPGVTTSSFAAAPSPAPLSPAPLSPAPLFPAPPSANRHSATSSSAAERLTAPPSATPSPDGGSRVTGTDWPTRQSAGHRDRPDGRPAQRAGQLTSDGTETVRSLAFWRNPTDGARITPARPDLHRPGVTAAPGIDPAGPALSSAGLPAAGMPATGRSVIGTPPPAVSGQHSVSDATHRASGLRPGMLPSAAADGSSTETDGLR
ncbi:MAG TPA: hypothetical protein VMA72_29465 [Streptosporangiaceae bacterium]|nr:hypothetical protein [Streptosporangiaceae bacterium]